MKKVQSQIAGMPGITSKPRRSERLASFIEHMPVTVISVHPIATC
jgi:hypothetical protein